MGSTAVADIRNESYPEYVGRIDDTYIDGYDPVSLSAPHSSLTRNSTWVAMGLILSTLFGIGLAVWGAGAMVYGFGSQTHDLAQRLLILGISGIESKCRGSAWRMNWPSPAGSQADTKHQLSSSRSASPSSVRWSIR